MIRLVIAMLILTTSPAHSKDDSLHSTHDTLGWKYDLRCCHNKDCRPMVSSKIKEGKLGYTMPSGELIPYKSTKIEQSGDDMFHWCTIQGADNTHTLCLYVPNRSF